MSQIHKLCGMEKMKAGRLIRCKNPATWEHPRWPNAYYCDRHKQNLIGLVPTGWKEVKDE